MKIYGARGELILELDKWPRPKQPVLHWQPGRSAMEFARIWFRDGSPELPAEYRVALENVFPGLRCLEVYPEHVTSLPESGEGRNHDALLLMTSDVGELVVGVEAKADEPFGTDGETVGNYRQRMLSQRNAGTSTRVPERIDQLVSLVGVGATTAVELWDEVPYQLLAATAGVVIEARKRNAAGALIVHEFVSPQLDQAKLKKNHEGIQLFVSAVFNVTESGEVLGPADLGGTPFSFIRLETHV